VDVIEKILEKEYVISGGSLCMLNSVSCMMSLLKMSHDSYDVKLL